MRRREKDAIKLMKKGFKVHLVEGQLDNFIVEFNGPEDSCYEGYMWRVNVELPCEYPIEAPIINFGDHIYHPNIDESSGFMCMNDLDNEKWKPDYDLEHVFEEIIPILLLNPNLRDPYNQEAAQLMSWNRQMYEDKVRDHCRSNANAIGSCSTSNKKKKHK